MFIVGELVIGLIVGAVVVGGELLFVVADGGKVVVALVFCPALVGGNVVFPKVLLALVS